MLSNDLVSDYFIVHHLEWLTSEAMNSTSERSASVVAYTRLIDPIDGESEFEKSKN